MLSVAGRMAASTFGRGIMGSMRASHATVGSWRNLGSKADPWSVLPKVKEGTPGETPSVMDQATGLERGEIDNPDLFKHNEVLVGPFGTAENPVKIQSIYNSRIVGCTGRAQPDDHDLVWLTVVKDKQIQCPECGQVFVLDPL